MPDLLHHLIVLGSCRLWFYLLLLLLLLMVLVWLLLIIEHVGWCLGLREVGLMELGLLVMGWVGILRLMSQLLRGV